MIKLTKGIRNLSIAKLKCERCDDRIVSIHQPHVRPIIRGKANKSAEFGAKLSASLISRLSEIHATLREQMELSSLRNEVGFTLKVEAAYRDMWKNWCKKVN